MPRLDVYQSLWAMDPGRGSHEAVTTEESFAMVKNAGFAGIAIDLSASDRETAYKTMPLFREKESVNIEFETHRNSVTNDLGYTTRLLEAVPDMKLGVDLSHYVVDREVSLPLRKDEADLIDKILRRADAFQGRISSAQQIQLQLEFPQHQKWVVQFLDWWEAGFRYWRKRAAADDTLIFQTELAPPEYAMTGPDGMEMSNRWEESLIMKGWIEDLWKRLEKEEIDAAVSSEKVQT